MVRSSLKPPYTLVHPGGGVLIWSQWSGPLVGWGRRWLSALGHVSAGVAPITDQGVRAGLRGGWRWQTLGGPLSDGGSPIRLTSLTTTDIRTRLGGLLCSGEASGSMLLLLD